MLPRNLCPKKYFSILRLSHFSFSIFRVDFNFCTWSVQSHFVNTKRSSIYTRKDSNKCIKSLIFFWKVSDELVTLIGWYLQEYFIQGKIVAHKLHAFSLNRIWNYPMFKRTEVAYWKTSNFNNISLILGIGYGLRFNCLFMFLRTLIKRTWVDLGLGCAKHGAPYSDFFALSRNPSRNKCSTSLKIYIHVTLFLDMVSSILA